MDKLNLFKIVSRRDSVAFGRVYDKYLDRIYRFIYFKIQSVEEAEDITAEVFLKAWQYLVGPNGREISNINAFLYRLARNSVIDFYRKKRDITSLDEIEEIVADERVDILRRVEVTIEVEKIWQCLDELKEDYKEAVILRHVEGFSISEIAKIIEKNSGATRVLIHRALATLRKKIDEKQP